MASGHKNRQLEKIKAELERRNLRVRRTTKGHLLITDPATGRTTMIGGESINGTRGNRNVYDAKSQLKVVNAHDISTKC